MLILEQEISAIKKEISHSRVKNGKPEYSDTLKRRVVNLTEAYNGTASQLSRKLNIPRQIFYEWRRQYRRSQKSKLEVQPSIEVFNISNEMQQKNSKSNLETEAAIEVFSDKIAIKLSWKRA